MTRGRLGIISAIVLVILVLAFLSHLRDLATLEQDTFAGIGSVLHAAQPAKSTH